LYKSGLKDAQKAYLGKAGVDEAHHVTPVYLGGPRNGLKTNLDGAYHQRITNEFRGLWAYGKGMPSFEELREILRRVYGKFPLPPAKGR